MPPATFQTSTAATQRSPDTARWVNNVYQAAPVAANPILLPNLISSPIVPETRLRQLLTIMSSGTFGQARPVSKEMTMASRLFLLEHAVDARLAAVERRLNQLQSHESAKDRSGIVTPPESEKERDGSANTKETGGVAATSTWMPLEIRRMPAFMAFRLDRQPRPLEELRPFSARFLKNFLGGTEWANGMYHRATAATEHKMGKEFPSKTYYVVEQETDPFVPNRPGEHGAKLVVLMRDIYDDEMCNNVPLFVALGGGKEYHYMGHYSQTRWSDRLDHERAANVVPAEIREHWAEKLADAKRPEWMTEELKRTLCLKPEFAKEDLETGDPDEQSTELSSTPAPSVGGCDDKAGAHVAGFWEEMRGWKHDAHGMIQKLTKAELLRAFERADGDVNPGLRFWWEYLECVGFHRPFYYLLAQAMDLSNA